jgi:hypothetical protein
MFPDIVVLTRDLFTSARSTGLGDGGKHRINLWKEVHKCNSKCKMLKLRPVIDIKDPDDEDDSDELEE